MNTKCLYLLNEIADFRDGQSQNLCGTSCFSTIVASVFDQLFVRFFPGHNGFWQMACLHASRLSSPKHDLRRAPARGFDEMILLPVIRPKPTPTIEGAALSRWSHA